MKNELPGRSRPVECLVGMAGPKNVEEELRTTLERTERIRADMLAVLDQLDLGTALTDENGCVTFLNAAARRILELGSDGFNGRHWSEVFSLGTESTSRLLELTEAPEHRERLTVQVEARGGQRRKLDIEVRQDARDPRRKVFLFHDPAGTSGSRQSEAIETRLEELVGQSASMRFVRDQIVEVARVDSTVLIDGETGTGKELVARAIHSSSRRNRKPLVPVNCAAISDSLVASQLFGHRRGSFTGAVSDQQGLFEAAQGGTLFLDEVGDIPIAIQTNLLRALEEREITRIGEPRPRKVDVRIIAATSRNLDRLVATGSFRADLLYRIRVARIALTPLRERREDVTFLVSRFLAGCALSAGKKVSGVSDEAMRLLAEYPWPGNVRELKNAIEFSVIRCKGSMLEVADLPPEIVGFIAPLDTNSSVGPDEKERLNEAMRRAGGNRSLAARNLGIGRATLYRWIARHRLDAEG